MSAQNILHVHFWGPHQQALLLQLCSQRVQASVSLQGSHASLVSVALIRINVLWVQVQVPHHLTTAGGSPRCPGSECAAKEKLSLYYFAGGCIYIVWVYTWCSSAHEDVCALTVRSLLLASPACGAFAAFCSLGACAGLAALALSPVLSFPAALPLPAAVPSASCSSCTPQDITMPSCRKRSLQPIVKGYHGDTDPTFGSKPALYARY